MLLKGQIIPLRSNSFYKDMDPSETATHFSLDKVVNIYIIISIIYLR